MMWDFSGAQQSYGNPPPQLAIPSPAPYPPNVPRGRSHSFSGQPFPASAPVASSPYLTVPQTYAPPVVHAHSDSSHHHHRHSRHSHHHHRSHSNPPPEDRGLIFVDQHHSHSYHRHTHSHGHSTPQLHIHQSTPMPAPPIHYQHASAPAMPNSHHQNHLQLIPPAHPTFQYSKCTGRKKALCIGINYIGQPHELRGCINDARHMRDFLVRHWGYKPNDIVLLTDDSPNPRQQPTRRNIIEAMRWLVSGAHTHDALFFHYSGHGGQTPDRDGDEVDGYDEVIYPVDFKKRGHIVDDEMHDIMVKPLPAGCRLTGVFDSCHSGTVLDLPYIYSSSGRLKGSHIKQKARARKATPADVISWSGCKDGQTSADTFHGGVAVGAMSYAFINSLTQYPKQSYQQLLQSVRSILYPKYQQKPQLGSSHPIDTSLRFVI